MVTQCLSVEVCAALVGLSISACLCQRFWCHSREIPLHLWVPPAVVSISSFKPHVNKTVIERALRPPVSSYLHLGNMHKSCLYGYSLWGAFWLMCVCVSALNRSHNGNKDSWPDNSKLQTLFSCSSFCSSSLALMYSSQVCRQNQFAVLCGQFSI